MSSLCLKPFDNAGIATYSPIICCYLKPILFCVKGYSTIYNTYINSDVIPTCQSKWNTYFHISQSDWKKIHSWVFSLRNDSYSDS